MLVYPELISDTKMNKLLEHQLLVEISPFEMYFVSVFCISVWIGTVNE